MNVKSVNFISKGLVSFLMSKTIQLVILLCFVLSVNAQTGTPFNPLDLDGDGILNVDDNDVDGDGIPNDIDLDDDNDGVYDIDETGGSVPLLSGFEVLYSSNSTSSLPTGSRAIVRNAINYSGVFYHAIVEVTSTGGLGSGSVIVTSGKNLALKDVTPVNNPYFTYTLKFVSSVGFVDNDYKNSNPIIGTTIPKVTVILADIDGSSNYAEIAGYKSTSDITKAPVIGSALTAVTSSIGGFEFGTTGQGGPGATAYNYFRPAAATATNGGSSSGDNDQTNWITLFYDSFTIGEYVFGDSGKGTSVRGEGGPSMFMGNVDFADIDGDGIPNIYDLDSDNDGCSDSNEYYGDPNYAAQNQQFGITNGGVAAVYSDGSVKAALYDGTLYANALSPAKVSAPTDVLLATGVTTTSFSVTTQGLSGSQTYKWQLSTNGGTTWADITNGGVYAGAGTNTLALTGITSAMNNYNYRVLVDGASANYICGTITSLSAKLGFLNAPPVANNDSATTLMETSVIVQVASNDTDSDGTVNATTIDLDPLTVGVQNTVTVTGEGTYTANSNGTVTFVPVANYKGVSSVNYVIQDNLGAISNVGSIQVTVVSCFDNPDLDCDNDGLSNSDEGTRGTDPANPDSDGDGVIDGTEVTDGTDPLDPCNSNQSHATLPKSGIYLTTSCDIEIFNGVSPLSDDEDNRVFMIRNIEKYPNNSLQVYNRWGVIVYEANGYGIGNKFFRGVSEGRSTVSASSELPEGTYFYALKYVNSNGETKERTGYLYINR